MHPPIIEKEIFNAVQLKIKKYHNIKKNKSKNNDLINLIYCMECHAKIGLNNKKNQSYCVCNNYKKNYKEKKCTPHTINYGKIKKIIIEELNKDINNEFNLKELVFRKKELEKTIMELVKERKKEIEIKNLNNMLKEIIKKIKENIIKKRKINNDIYINMIDRIYLSEDGKIELYLNYICNH